MRYCNNRRHRQTEKTSLKFDKEKEQRAVEAIKNYFVEIDAKKHETEKLLF